VASEAGAYLDNDAASAVSGQNKQWNRSFTPLIPTLLFASDILFRRGTLRVQSPEITIIRSLLSQRVAVFRYAFQLERTGLEPLTLRI
jgi:hypothetical protein